MRERAVFTGMVRARAARVGIAPAAMQAALWYREQRPDRKNGVPVESQNFTPAARTSFAQRGLDPVGSDSRGGEA